MKISEIIRRANGEKPDYAIDDIGDIGHWQGMNDAALIAEAEELAQLSNDQQVVLEWLKREHFDSYIKSVLSNLYFYVNMTAIGDLENKEIQEMVNAYEKLSQEDFAQVLQVFANWALEHEGEE